MAEIGGIMIHHDIMTTVFVRTKRRYAPPTKEVLECRDNRKKLEVKKEQEDLKRDIDEVWE